jgi:hypothetical protein
MVRAAESKTPARSLAIHFAELSEPLALPD